MKLLRLLPLVIIVLCQNVFAQDQMKYWALPPYKIDFSAATPATTLLPGSNVSTPYVVSNAAYDEFGNVVFYVKNDDVYSATGMPAGTLPNMSDGGYTYHYIQNEITIVPVPGTCKIFMYFM